MKITSASKKVLASALSAAMVVAFAPTVAFATVAGETDTSKWTEADFIAAGAIAKKTSTDGAIVNEYYFSVADLDAALSGLPLATAAQVKAGSGLVDYKGAAFTDSTVTDATGVIDAQLEKYSATQSSTAITDVNLIMDYVPGTDHLYDATTDPYNEVSAETVAASKTAILNAIAGIYYGTGATAASGTVKLLDNVKADHMLTAYAAASGLTLDLNGKTLSTKAAEDEGTYSLLSVTGEKFTVKGGTLNAANNKAAGNTYYAIVDQTATKVYLEDVVADEISGTIDGAKGTVKLGDISGALTAEKQAIVEVGTIGGGAEAMEGSSLTATAKATKTGQNGIAIDGGLTVGKNATVTATATSSVDDIVAIAIDNSLTATAQGAKVVATAKSTGDANAIAINGGAVAGKDITASADSAGGTAIAVKASGDIQGTFDDDYTESTTGATLKGGSYTASGATAAKSLALSAGTALISGGSFDGKLDITKGYNYLFNNITAGSFTDNPTDFVNTYYYDVAFSGGTYTVSQFKGFDLKAPVSNASNEVALSKYIEGALEEIAKGGTVAGLSFSEGWDAAKLLDKAKNPGADGKVGITLKVKQFNAKTATDAQKAAKAAIEEAVKADLSKTTDEVFYNVSVTIGFLAKDAVEETVIATVSDMGKVASGLSTVDNKLALSLNDIVFAGTANACEGKTAWAYSGSAAKVAFKDTDNDGKPNDKAGIIEITAVPTVIAVSALDEEALKDAAQKGEEVATEKATQGIDVDQKSMTVKIGAKKTKTAKAKSFNMGVTAETAVTTEWKSGSTKITVSGDKVKLAKGAKKGTYKAQISIKAAASDAYLAAAKTITVKFVIKK